MAGPVAFVLKGYPRLSETFIAQEIRALEQRGLDIHLYSLRHPMDGQHHPVHDEILASVTYLPEYLHREPGRSAAAWRAARRLPGYAAAHRVWRRDFGRDRTRNRIRRFGQAMVLATSLPPETARIHAHFLHTPASVARYAALMTQLPWSASAHAKDIWTIPDWEKREKLDDLDWMVTCTRFGATHLKGLTAQPDKVNLVYHGLDLSRFAPVDTIPTARDGRSPTEPVVLMSVGRAVAKKGFAVLIEALAALPPALHWRWVHIGGGELLSTLQADAAQRGLSEKIEWRGAQAQTAVLQAYRDADLFILPSLTAADGDRDGLPNVLMEAQSQGLCCLSTTTSGIPELIDHKKTGILVEPGDVTALSAAIGHLITEPVARNAFGMEGQARVHRAFDADVTIERLATLFGLDR